MVAAKIEHMRQGERTDIEPSANLHKVARADAARQVNVSVRSVASAAAVRDKALPAIREAVEQGKMSVSEAAVAARLDYGRQERIAESVAILAATQTL
jgi:hypothetical protein